MEQPGKARRNFQGATVGLDILAFILGAAVGYLHFRPMHAMLARSRLGITVLTISMIWIALVSAGPFLFLVRRFIKRSRRYPRVGDVLWLLAGIPWVMTVLLQPQTTRGIPGRIFSGTVLVAVVVACLIVLSMISSLVNAAHVDSAAKENTWTNRIGICVAATYLPVICCSGLLVSSNWW